MKSGNAPLLMLSTLIACLCLISCAPAAGLTDFTDDSGNAITLADPPSRIISLAPSNTEIIYALGLEDRLVGVTEYCNYPPAAKTKARVGGFSTVDLEKAVALKPDLALATDIHVKSVTPLLQKLGFTVMTLNPRTVNAALKDINLLGQVTGRASAALELTTSLVKRVDAVAVRTGKLTPGQRSRVLLMIWNDPLMAAGGDTLIADIINIAGGENIASAITGYGSISLETVISRDPQIIIVPTQMGQSANPLRDYINSDPRFKSVSAVKNKRVYEIDGDLIYRYSPRCVSALEQVASFLHPELFGEAGAPGQKPSSKFQIPNNMKIKKLLLIIGI